MGRGGDKIKDDFRFNSGKRAWDGMQGRGELRMGRGGDKISRKTIFSLKQ